LRHAVVALVVRVRILFEASVDGERGGGGGASTGEAEREGSVDDPDREFGLRWRRRRGLLRL
jgi:hypothetical protein